MRRVSCNCSQALTGLQQLCMQSVQSAVCRQSCRKRGVIYMPQLKHYANVMLAVHVAKHTVLPSSILTCCCSMRMWRSFICSSSSRRALLLLALRVASAAAVACTACHAHNVRQQSSLILLQSVSNMLQCDSSSRAISCHGAKAGRTQSVDRLLRDAQHPDAAFGC